MMKVAILISGFLRTINYNIKKNKQLFDNYDVDYFLHISNDELNTDNYINNSDYIEILKFLKPVQVIFENEMKCNTSKFHNMKCMWYKLHLLNNMSQLYSYVNNINYDIIIRLRPDVYILDDKLELCNVKNDIIYGVNDDFFYANKYTFNKVGEISTNLDKILAIMSKKNKERKSDIFIEYLEYKNIKLENHNINYKLILTLCNIIAISGDSGSGKTTLMNAIATLFDDNLLKIEGDRYHKWERNDIKWNEYTHLNPIANHIDKLKDDIYNLKIGNNIYQVDYDHRNGKFTERREVLSKNNIILCGLHTLFYSNTNKLYNLKIFLDCDERLRYYWKLNRDILNRGYTKENVLASLNKRKSDSYTFIKPQSVNSDLIIIFFTDKDFNYVDLKNNPNIYLEIKIKKYLDIQNFIEILNDNSILFIFKNKPEYISIIFNKIQKKFINVLLYIITKTTNTINFKNEPTDYYTIIKSLIIYLKL